MWVLPCIALAAIMCNEMTDFASNSSYAVTTDPAGKGARSKSSRVSLSPEDWLRSAADLLVERSVEGVRVDVLARALGVTRGSFYWHFTDRDDLLQRLLASWKQRQTELVIAAHGRLGVSPAEVIRDLAALPFRGASAQRGAAIELAVRAWARRDDRARAVVDQVDAERLDYIESCFVQLGFEAKAAANRAFLLYSYMQGESQLRSLGSEAQKDARRVFVEQLLTMRTLPI